MKLTDVAAALNARLEGDGAAEVMRAVHPAEASGATDLAVAMDRALLPLLTESPAGAAVVLEGTEPPPGPVRTFLFVPRAANAMVVLTRLFDRPVVRPTGIHPSAVIDPSARLSAGVVVGPLVVIGPDTEVGEGTVLLSHVTLGAGVRVGRDGLFHPGVRVGDRCRLGDRVILHHNASIGADGFSFITPAPGSVESAKLSGRVEATNVELRRINSLGAVTIGDDVEIGANTAIDRGTLADTRIGRGTKIDDLVLIGHNVQVGESCMLCGHVGIAGSAIIGDRVVLAGRVGVADHVRIGDDAVVGAGSGVGSNVAPKTVVLGYPAQPRERAMAQFMMLGRLKTLFQDVAGLKAQVKAIVQAPEKS